MIQPDWRADEYLYVTEVEFGTSPNVVHWKGETRVTYHVLRDADIDFERYLVDRLIASIDVPPQRSDVHYRIGLVDERLPSGWPNITWGAWRDSE